MQPVRVIIDKMTLLEATNLGILDFFFGSKPAKSEPQDNPAACDVRPEAVLQLGPAEAQKVYLDEAVIKRLHRSYVAFDTETTGLNSSRDRIVEIGAVLFENGVPAKTFETLVNPGIPIPAEASAVNHITNRMLRSAPDESTAFRDFALFLKDCGALHGETIICAHNARFDFGCLINTLTRLGYAASMKYLDTLSLSRRYIPELDNYKQATVEQFFNLKNRGSHRAQSDAEMCGQILRRLLELASQGICKQKGTRYTRSGGPTKTFVAPKVPKPRMNTAENASPEPTITTQHKRARCIAVLQTRDDGSVVAEFASIAAAARSVCVNAGSIRDVLQGKQNHAAGYRWKYKN